MRKTSTTQHVMISYRSLEERIPAGDLFYKLSALVDGIFGSKNDLLNKRYLSLRISHGNFFVASLFKTAKYRPEFLVIGFLNLEAARIWGHVSELVHQRASPQLHIPHVMPTTHHLGARIQSRSLVEEHSRLVTGSRHTES